MNFDDGYNQCKEDVRKILADKKLEGLWEDIKIMLL